MQIPVFIFFKIILSYHLLSERFLKDRKTILHNLILNIKYLNLHLILKKIYNNLFNEIRKY